MAQRIPFFELFEGFAPPIGLRVLLTDARVTDVTVEQESRTMALALTVLQEITDSERTLLEQLLADRFALNGVRISLTQGGFPKQEPRPSNAGGGARKESSAGKIIMGREIKGHPMPMSELNPKAGNVVVEGKVFKCEFRELRQPGMWLALIEMTDYEGSVIVRKRMLEKDVAPLRDRVSTGMWLRVAGTMELTYDGHDMQLNPRDVTEITHEPRMDTAEVKRVELHLHTRMSNMDALTDTGSVVKLAAKWGMPAIAITDHGVAQSFPDAWHAGEGKIKILYGCEGYFVNNIDDRIAIHGHQDIGFSDEIVCFDIETTGLKVTQEAITEIGAVRLRNGEIVETFQTFVDPERRLTPEIIGLTGITDAMLSGAPSPKEALTAFLSFVNGRPLAAHNAEFDISFIRAGCRREGIPFDPTYVDSLILAQNLLPELHKFKLDIVAEYLDLPAFNHHRASDDAAMVAYMLIPFFQKMEKELGIRRLQDINPQMLKLRPRGSKSSRFPKHIILIAKGAHKAEMVEKMLRGPVTEDIPASVLQLHPNCEFLLDAEAAKYVMDLV